MAKPRPQAPRQAPAKRAGTPKRPKARGDRNAPLKALNDRHRVFVAELLIDDNAARAYEAAGFTARGNSAEVNAMRLKRQPLIIALLASERAARAERLAVTADWVLEKLRDNVERAMQAQPVRDKDGEETGEYRYDGAVANGALNLLGKALGMFVERHAGPNGAEPIPVAVTVTRRIIRPGAAA